MFTAVTIEITEIHGQRRDFFWSQRGKSAPLSFYLTHIQTTWDTHGFWVCRRPSPPLHSPGQYPQPGWSSLNSPVFTHAKRECRRYHNAPKPLVFVVLKPDEALRPANLEVLFELLLFSEFLEVATGLRLLPLLGKLSAGDGRGERNGRANLKILARQIRWQYCESAEGWESGRNSMAREPAEGRRAKLRWQKRELCQGVRGLVCKCSPENILSGLHLLPFIWLCIETKMLIYLKCPGTARSQVAQGLLGQPQRDGQRDGQRGAAVTAVFLSGSSVLLSPMTLTLGIDKASIDELFPVNTRSFIGCLWNVWLTSHIFNNLLRR